MSNIDLLPRLEAKSVRKNGTQCYVDAQGTCIPSVTTVLNATKPQEQRERLANWRQRQGTDEANRIATAASRRGTQTHKQIQCYLQGKDIVCPDASRPYWESIKPVLQNIDNIRLIESPVFHYDLSYAGVVDCVANYQGIPCICEWKTADKPKGAVERLYDYPLQLAAYLGAANQCYQTYNLEINSALLVVAIPEMPAEVFWFESVAMVSYWQHWEERVAAYWQRKGKRNFKASN